MRLCLFNPEGFRVYTQSIKGHAKKLKQEDYGNTEDMNPLQSKTQFKQCPILI